MNVLRIEKLKSDKNCSTVKILNKIIGFFKITPVPSHIQSSNSSCLKHKILGSETLGKGNRQHPNILVFFWFTYWSRLNF